jgi:hypothetical protein
VTPPCANAWRPCWPHTTSLNRRQCLRPRRPSSSIW